MTNPPPLRPTNGQPPANTTSWNKDDMQAGINASIKPTGDASIDSALDAFVDAGVPASPEDEMLVAYLDGELDVHEVTQVETQLASQPRLKRRLDELRSAWDLLEELPPATPNPNFAQSTIEMVAMSAAAIEASPVERRRSRRWWIATLVLAPIMLALGYVATRASQRYVERHTIEQVHLLADWDAFKAVDNLEWLEKLAEVPDITRVAKRSATSGLAVDIVPPTVSERRQWIQSLSPTDRDRLSANLEEFKRVSPQESQRLLKLADQVYAHKNRDQYLQLARSYSIFLTDMAISDRTSHRDQKDVQIRLSDLKRRVNRKLVEVHASELSDEDRAKVAEWTKRMQDEYGDSLPRGLTIELFRRVMGDGDSVIMEEDLDMLYSMLSPESQEILGRLQTKEDLHKAMVFYFVRNSSRSRTNRAELIERFQQLPAGRQAELEFLPPETAQQQLRDAADGRMGPGRRPPSFRGSGR